MRDGRAIMPYTQVVSDSASRVWHCNTNAPSCAIFLTTIAASIKADVMTSTRGLKVQNFSAQVFTSQPQMCFTRFNVTRKLALRWIAQI
jgi:hypothetical protein